MGSKFINIISTLLFYISILTFIIAFNFAHNPPGGWYQQFLPSLPNFQVSDMYFLDSLNGWIVSGNSMPNDTSGYILKTTNGGDNWQLKYTDFRDFSRIKFLNFSTGFVSGGYGNGARIYKSTNGGENWFAIGIPGGGQIYFDDMSVLNEDTIRVVARNGFVGGVFRTTNGGVNWTNQASSGDFPDKIYMYNSRIGFIGFNAGTPTIKKTTDGGFNWFTVSNEGFTDIEFIDSLTGWKCWNEVDSIKKTTDGGISWEKQLIPPTGGFFAFSSIVDLAVINAITIWGVGSIATTSLGFRGLIYKSTNGGDNWGYQLPDTSIIVISRYFNIDFINELNGWAYSNIGRGVHTVLGGDTTYYPTSVTQISGTTPSDYKLFQNYPNPFNPLTKIKYELKTPGFIKLNVYNINGKEVKTIVNEKQNTGVYEADFSATEYGSSLSSGVYFYSLFAGEELVDTKKMIVLK
ncbi:MAG: T9SS type A sorting domain-containing protein [Ignavibacteria bacterium]|nr:T9SS type A sorting domain-containing protein [Ignavibacteria bacterium]